jgi:indolepyruvate ferredoxin oxidoreductase beta subunit
MKRDFVLAGVGGQGILSIAAIIGTAAVNLGYHLKQAEVHGMSQRGGDVMSNLRISKDPIASDLIPIGGADVIIGLEPLEALRHLPMLAPDGWIIANTTPIKNISNYPDVDLLLAEFKNLDNCILIDAEQIANDMNAKKSVNMVLLGAACPFLGIDTKEIEKAVHRIFGRKGEKVVQQNLDAIQAGRDAAMHTCK